MIDAQQRLALKESDWQGFAVDIGLEVNKKTLKASREVLDALDKADRKKALQQARGVLQPELQGKHRTVRKEADTTVSYWSNRDEESSDRFRDLLLTLGGWVAVDLIVLALLTLAPAFAPLVALVLNLPAGVIFLLMFLRFHHARKQLELAIDDAERKIRRLEFRETFWGHAVVEDREHWTDLIETLELILLVLAEKVPAETERLLHRIRRERVCSDELRTAIDWYERTPRRHKAEAKKSLSNALHSQYGLLMKPLKAPSLYIPPVDVADGNQREDLYLSRPLCRWRNIDVADLGSYIVSSVRGAIREGGIGTIDTVVIFVTSNQENLNLVADTLDGLTQGSAMPSQINPPRLLTIDVPEMTEVIRITVLRSPVSTDQLLLSFQTYSGEVDDRRFVPWSDGTGAMTSEVGVPGATANRPTDLNRDLGA